MSTPSSTSISMYRPGVRDTVMHALARAVERNPDGEFLLVDGKAITYRHIDHDANAMARKFQELGIKKGDTVVTLLETSLDVFVCWFAINKLGAIWVPINTAYRGEYLRHQVTDTGARLAICDPETLERFVHLADLLPDLQLILCRSQDELPICTIPIRPLDEYRGVDGTSLPILVEPSDLAALIYTSGTTGPSKGCMISHNFMCMQGRQHRRLVPQEQSETGWTCLPMFHTAALIFVLGALVEGMRVGVSSRFSVARFWEEVEAADASNCLLMASIFPLIAHAPDCDAAKRHHGKLRMIFGVPITRSVRQIWKERFGVQVVSSWSYGQTEGVRLTSAYVNETPPEDCAGRPTDEYEIMIVNADDQPVPDGVVGEIVYRPREANVMFEGYWRRPEDTSEVMRNLWMHSGDLGKMIDGYLYFCDRTKDYLRSRGENVSSFEVERAFMGHHAIAEVAVHAVGAQSGEDDIKATIVLRAVAVLDEKDLCLWAIENLPYFAVPRYFEFRHELPKNPTGRVLKYQLREEGVTDSTWDREAAGIVVRRRH
jgi:carnitine-CoA ligase